MLHSTALGYLHLKVNHSGKDEPCTRFCMSNLHNYFSSCVPKDAVREVVPQSGGRHKSKMGGFFIASLNTQ